MAGSVAEELVVAAGEGGLRQEDVVGDGRLHQSRLQQHQAVVGDDVYHMLGPRVVGGAPYVFHPHEGALLGAEAVGLRGVRALVRERLAVRVGKPGDVVGIEVLVDGGAQPLLRQRAQHQRRFPLLEHEYAVIGNG